MGKACLFPKIPKTCRRDQKTVWFGIWKRWFYDFESDNICTWQAESNIMDSSPTGLRQSQAISNLKKSKFQNPNAKWNPNAKMPKTLNQRVVK